jgi:hypothetical protein
VRCRRCPYEADTAFYLQKHVNDTHAEDWNICGVCGVKAWSKVVLQVHIK